MKSSKYIAIAVAIIAVIWVASGFVMPESETPAPQTKQESPAAEKKAMDVRVRESKAESYTDKVEITGRSRASKSVTLKAETAGQLDKLFKEEGDAVTADEVLAQMELRDRQARVDETRQRVNQRSIEYNAAKRLKDRGFNSKIKFSQSLADLEDAKAALKQAQVDLTKTKIKAPFDGTISQQQVELGDYVAVGDALFTLVNLDPIEFVGFVSERRIGDVKLDAPARAVFLDGSDIETTVSYIAPTASEQTRTFRIIVSAPNEDFSLKEGLTANIYIPAGEKKAHKISPSILSLNDDGAVGVKIVNDQNKVEFVPVRILADTPDSMWVSGPADTARIITVGQDFVSEGQEVNPVLSDGEGLL